MATRTVKATVQRGEIVVDPAIELPEGAEVTVAFTTDDDHLGEQGGFLLTPAEEAALAEAEAEADRGETVSWDSLKNRLQIAR